MSEWKELESVETPICPLISALTVKQANKYVECVKEKCMLWSKCKGLDEAERQHGEWVDVPKYKGFYVCSKCLERLGGDFERFDHWEMKKENFCPVCGSDNRKVVQSEKDNDRNRG